MMQRVNKRTMQKGAFLLLLITLFACASPAPTEDELPDETAAPMVLPTSEGIPPTFTPSSEEPTAVPTVTPIPAPEETRLPATPIPFDDPVVTLRLRIPAIAYDRHLVGTVGSVVTLADETSRRGQERRGQAVVLIELQQALKDIELDPLPPDCDTCPQLEVTLPLDEIELSGWLRDPVLLASIQNYFAVAFGPHFPPETIVGLRRSASPFAAAQNIALTADNHIWLWQETDEQILQPIEAEEGLLTAVSQTFEGRYFTEYTAPCQGVPIETLLLDPIDLDPLTITIACPAYALSTNLLPLYTQIDTLLADAFETIVSVPETAMPLTAVLQYQREDDQTLTIFQDGFTTLTDSRDNLITGTLTLEQVNTLTQPLIDSELVQLGLATFEQEPAPNALLLVRGERGVLDAGFESGQTAAALEPLNRLIDSQLAPPATSADTTPTPEGSGTPSASSTAESTPSPTPQSEPTPTPSS